MKKLSKLFNDKKTKVENLYKGDFIQINKIDDWECITEKSISIVAIPHLIEFNEILLRKEYIPPFKYVDNKKYHLTCIAGGIENNENSVETLFRELEEEAGIRLNTTYNKYENWGEYFINKGITNKVNIYYIPLNISDYKKVEAVGDGSKSENLSSTIRVDLKYLEYLKPADLVTTLCIEFFKSKIFNKV